jgi:carbon storage regulator
MLVLRRKAGESIIIDNTIQVLVLAVEGDRVKVGIKAPENITILREELLSSSQQEAHTPFAITH